jgi:hypothetical protein
VKAPGTVRMTGCRVARKCAAAWRCGESSQQPTWPHVRHSRSATQTVPSAVHSSHAPGVRGGGKSAAISASRCSHDGIGSSAARVVLAFASNRGRVAPLARSAKRRTSAGIVLRETPRSQAPRCRARSEPNLHAFHASTSQSLQILHLICLLQVHRTQATPLDNESDQLLKRIR